jgi:OTU-like cysteine protease.
MENRNYLTEMIFLLNNKLYYESNDSIKEVKKNDWHHILSDYGWEKLHKQWIKKLNTFLPKPNNNSLFGCLDCGEDGDCLFHSICYAISNEDNEVDATILRRNISERLTKENYNSIIEYYKILYEKNDFEEDWNPNEVSFLKFKEILIKGGENYWGDFLILNLIREYLNINIIVLNSNEIDK